MANELKHASQGTSLTQAEFEAVGLHVFDSQATGDIAYASSAAQLSRLAIGGTTGMILQVASGIPAWSSGGLIFISETVADDGSILLTDASNGFCYATCNGEYMLFAFFSDGSVQEIGAGSANVAYTDSDGNLCAYDTGTQVAIKNRLGDSYTCKGVVIYLP